MAALTDSKIREALETFRVHSEALSCVKLYR